MVKIAVHVVASRPPERRPTATPTLVPTTKQNRIDLDQKNKIYIFIQINTDLACFNAFILNFIIIRLCIPSLQNYHLPCILGHKSNRFLPLPGPA